MICPKDRHVHDNNCITCHPRTHRAAGDDATGGDTECQANVCTCADGAPAVGNGCHQNGATRCASCNEGLQLTAERLCVPEETASTGTAIFTVLGVIFMVFAVGAIIAVAITSKTGG